ncbi:StAR-related lipid transfer protein 7, mitochondrial [Linum perenne]
MAILQYHDGFQSFLLNPASDSRTWFLGYGYGSATLLSLLLILLLHFSKRLLLFIFPSSSSRSSSPLSAVAVAAPPTPSIASNPQFSSSELVSEADLKFLVKNLDEIDGSENWEPVVDKRNNLLHYTAKCCKPKNAPITYLSVTVFENCSPELLRDFYMDNNYRKQWDKTVVEHEQIQVDRSNGTEIGRTIKKFPLLTPREYILAWRLWEGNDKTFYCFIKECEHRTAPLQKKYVRVRHFRSGWRIRKGKLNELTSSLCAWFVTVPGRDACEIKMYHQEDAGLNVEMAKLAFSRGIWSYVCKMHTALCKYSPSNQLMDPVSALSLIQKVPPGIETTESPKDILENPTAPVGASVTESRKKRLEKRSSKKALTNGLLLIGGVICLSRGNCSLGAKVAMGYLLSKLGKRNARQSLER